VLRTHTCGELRASQVGQEVTICGWVDSYRDHGGGLFIDLRDRYGKTQVVFSTNLDPALLELAKTLRDEWVIQVVGRVAPRPEGTVNPKLPTGEIEVRCIKFTLLNKSAVPPFTPGMRDLPGEDLR
jgi:aspartyl-tRNA synthetase